MSPRTVLTPPTGRHLHPHRLTPAEAAADRLHGAMLRFLRRLRRQDAGLGLGRTGLSVLSVLVAGGPRTASQLAEGERVTRATMSRVIRRLERNGMVARDPDPRDGRSVLVRATPLGRRFMERGREWRAADLAGRLARLPSDDLRVLERAATLIDVLARGD